MDAKDRNQTEKTCGVRVVHMECVLSARRKAIPRQELNRLAETFKVLGNPTRLKILMALETEEMCVCDLAAFVNLSESAVSHQLRRLKDMDLVKNRRAGQILFYSLNDAHVEVLLDVGLKHIRE